MEDPLNDSLGPALDVNGYVDVANAVALANSILIDGFEKLGEAFKTLCEAGKLANQSLLDMQPALLSITTDPAFMPRKLKKAYWKIFENRRITWRERRKLDLWCKRGHTTLEKLSGKQANTETLN